MPRIVIVDAASRRIVLPRKVPQPQPLLNTTHKHALRLAQIDHSIPAGLAVVVAIELISCAPGWLIRFALSGQEPAGREEPKTVEPAASTEVPGQTPLPPHPNPAQPAVDGLEIEYQH
jgi:hypothetical protein